MLLPPLSNLEVVGEPLMMQTKRGVVNVCQLRVNVNLKGLTIDELQERRKTLHVSMCENLMSEAELTVMEKAVSAGDARWDELKEAVKAAVEEGRVLMERQALRSVAEFNNDSTYSKMLQAAVQVRALQFSMQEGGHRCEKLLILRAAFRRCCWLHGPVSTR